jgi:ribonucleoside-diphosphate reductase alpha chain
MTTSMSPFAKSIYLAKYAARDEAGELVETDWSETARRVVPTVLAALGYGPESDEVRDLTRLVEDRKFIPGGRYLYATGKDYHQTNNCLLLRAEDSREGWADLFHKAAMSLQTGAGIGVDYSAVRAKGARIRRTGGIASGPIELMKAVNELGRSVMQGGNRRSAIWAGLKWSHPDVFDFIHLKDWPEHIRAAKEKDFNAVAPMDMTNISVLLDDEFFAAYHDEKHPRHQTARLVMKGVVYQMFKTGEPGFSVNLGDQVNETLRNACTEVTSEDDSDVCNLGSINLARVTSLEEMRQVTRLGTLFLLAGTKYSDVPYGKVAETRAKNRRLGLGLMGLHEFLAVRGLKYEPSKWLGEYLVEYANSGEYAKKYAIEHGLSVPVATRAIAPTGTIAIVAETTTGIEPIFCVAYKRRYLDAGKVWKFQYVIDPTARKLVEQGVEPDSIEDAYTLSLDMERRVRFQAWLQTFVDMSISSTINMPAWGTPANDESMLAEYERILIQYLPKIRGITVYPDGARGGQPLSPVAYSVAAGNEGVVFEESDERCLGGVCGA